MKAEDVAELWDASIEPHRLDCDNWNAISGQEQAQALRFAYLVAARVRAEAIAKAKELVAAPACFECDVCEGYGYVSNEDAVDDDDEECVKCSGNGDFTQNVAIDFSALDAWAKEQDGR